MKHILNLTGKTSVLLAGLLLCFGMTALAAPSVEGDTQLTAVTDEVISADYTITADEDIESVTLTLSYNKDELTYMSGSGGNNFSGSGGNGQVQLSSKPLDKEAAFSVRFRGKTDGDTEVTITACTITVDGKEIDVLSGAALDDEEEGDDEEGEEDESGERASWVIDNRTFYLHRPSSIDGFTATKMEIQGITSRVLKSDTLDLYVIRLNSDNGSYRDDFVYNPETGNVIPFVQMKSGTDTVIFIEPEEDGYVPTRYVSVDLGWGAKYTIPALKHVIIDGVDEIQDDTNIYLIYGINQDGEKAWYSYDYDKESLALFDEVAYTGEQNYILDLEESIEGQKSEAAYLLETYNNDMGRRLYIILFMTILIIVLLNVVVMLYLKLRKLQNPQEEAEEEESEKEEPHTSGKFIVGDLEENETDFSEPSEEEEPELEIIDLDELDEEDE
jgi:uncharacterized membrane protein